MIRTFTLVSWIFTTVAAAYLGVVFTDIFAPPKELFCKLSLGYCLEPETIEFSAVDKDRIIDRRGVGQAVGRNQIGMLHNAVDINVERSNMVEYGFSAAKNTFYRLQVLYANNEERRSLTIKVNHAVVARNALGRTLEGGWNNQNREWSEVISVLLEKGDNTISFSSNTVFPHISKIRFKQVAEN